MNGLGQVFPYIRSPDQDRKGTASHPLVIVGAGPVGLVAALDLAQKGHKVVVLDKKSTYSDGSRAICWSKRTLEIMGRLGVGPALMEKGVTWKTGKVFNGERLVYEFDLLPESGHQYPAFINLQQYYFEAACVAAAGKQPGIDIRWQHGVSGVEPQPGGVRVTVETPEGPYQLEAGYLLAADGARSTVRHLLNLGFEGQVFNDQFLICDIKLAMARPAERWFWFDPPFNRGQSSLLHKQADNVWRLDFQIGPDADRDQEMKPENVSRRVRAMLGEQLDFSFEWISCYRFQCRRLERFRHGHVLFVGDAAHQVSPFGARGGNSGVQDADNLVWKLDAVLKGSARDALLDSYDTERRQAADENILNSTRSTDFISPKGAAANVFRAAVLDLAAQMPFARRLVNSGRLSVPATYDGSPLNSPDSFAPGEVPQLRPGAAAADAPMDAGKGWLLDQIGGRHVGVWFSGGPVSQSDRDRIAQLQAKGVPTLTLSGELPVRRYGADKPAFYLFRPDQHIAYRSRQIELTEIGAALARSGFKG